MRLAHLAIFALIVLPACQPLDELPTQSTSLPPLSVSLVSSFARRDLVRLVWSVRNDGGRQFEILRQNKAEPWKHFATRVPVDGQIVVEDTGVVPGQTYLYRLRILGTKDSFLDEIEVEVPR